MDKLIAQVTCGDVQIEGAVVLPTSLFGLVMDRLRSYEQSSAYKTEFLSTWHAKRIIKHFLARRCSKEFLERYLQTDPSMLDSIAKPGPHLEFSEDVDLAIRLFEFKLLPEELRQTLIEEASEHARRGDDPRVLVDPRLRAMLNEREASRLEHALRTELLPRLEAVRLTIEADYGEDDDDAEWHMRRFNQILTAVEEQYPQSRRIKNIVNMQRLRTQEWIEQRATPAGSASSRDIATEDAESLPVSSRSIFDDVDE